MANSEPTISAGDVVVLKSSSTPEMTVLFVEDDAASVVYFWYGQMCRETFPVAALKKV